MAQPPSGNTLPTPFPAGFASCSREKTTYGGMNEWVKSGRSSVPGNIPRIMSDTNWKEVSQSADTAAIPRAIMPSEKRTDEFYRRYSQLSAKIPYRFPNPPAPRERHGRIGGSWRHIKEVLGHGGSRVVFVDGLVRLYDYERNRGGSALMSGPGHQLSRVTPSYAVNRGDFGNSRVQHPELERRDQQMSPNHFDPTRWFGRGDVKKTLPATITLRGGGDDTPRSKYKGFYAIKRGHTFI